MNRTEFDQARAEKDRHHAALLAELEIPADGDRGTYLDRTLQAQWVKSRQPSSKPGGGGAITGTSGWTAACPQDVYDLLVDGYPYILETRNFSQVTGWLIDGTWYHRKTDRDLVTQLAQFITDRARRLAEELEANRAKWEAREAALPEWIRERLATFHNHGGEEFAAEGWAYELVVAELTVLYVEIGPGLLAHNSSTVTQVETPAIKAYAHEHGTTGNQHSMAIALAKQHLQQPTETLAGTIGALAPLTGSAFYEPTGEQA